MATVRPATERETRRNAAYAYVGAAVALTGAQMISPALPVMQEELTLSSTDVGLIMSVYLLPAAIFSIPAGILADRFGRRLIFGSAFIGFGICGILIPLVSSWWFALLAVRFVQGVMFAGLLPLTMTILGDIFTGTDLVAAQGRRSVAMSLGDGILPVIGGIVVAGGWFVPWLGQAIAIPFGVAVLANLVNPEATTRVRRQRSGGRELARLFRQASILVLEYMGFLRMFLKFSILTFLPLLLVDVRDFSPAFAGAVVGVAAGAGTLVALGAGRIARFGQPFFWIAAGVAGMGVALFGLMSMTGAGMILASAALYGAADGMMGVFTNSFVTSATGAELRASFVAITGAIRNLAKFAAPVVFGALVAAQGLTSSFAILAAVAVASALSAVALQPLQSAITASRGRTT